jgi:hypothetical protein
MHPGNGLIYKGWNLEEKIYSTMVAERRMEVTVLYPENFDPLSMWDHFLTVENLGLVKTQDMDIH